MQNLKNILLFYLCPHCMRQKKGTKGTRICKESQILDTEGNLKIFEQNSLIP